jgi:hypothetical protein
MKYLQADKNKKHKESYICNHWVLNPIQFMLTAIFKKEDGGRRSRKGRKCKSKRRRN